MPHDAFFGDLFIQRCSDPECGAIHILIGEDGEPCIAKTVLTPDSAREAAAELCRLAAEIEAVQPQGKRPN